MGGWVGEFRMSYYIMHWWDEEKKAVRMSYCIGGWVGGWVGGLSTYLEDLLGHPGVGHVLGQVVVVHVVEPVGL